MVAEAIHNRRVLCEDNAGGWCLKSSVVGLGRVGVGGEESPKVTSPIWCQEPRCTDRSRFSNSFGFPKRQSTVDGVDGIGSLWFTQIVGKSSSEITSLLAKFVRSYSFLHVEAFDRVATQVLNNFPKLNSTTKYRMLKSCCC